MRFVLQIASFAALAATAVAPMLFVTGQSTLPQTKIVMLVAAIGWFATAPLWMGRPKVDEELII